MHTFAVTLGRNPKSAQALFSTAEIMRPDKKNPCQMPRRRLRIAHVCKQAAIRAAEAGNATRT
jgi:hypothetical protein